MKPEDRCARLRQRDAGRLRPPVAQVKADAQGGHRVPDSLLSGVLSNKNSR